jgi:4-amino-4-deoxy-L-arabinose transferase-like glycosyltransferase
MNHRLLFVTLIAAFALRLVYALAQDSLRPYENTGGDTYWYLANAYALVSKAPQGSWINGVVTWTRALEQPPVYFIVTGLPQAFFSPKTAIVLSPGLIGWHLEVNSTSPQAIILIRFLQILMSVATCFFAYQMARLLITGGETPSRPYNSDNRATFAGLIAAAVLAVSPAFIMEAADIKTETTFIFFVAGGIWLYLEAIAREKRRTTFLILAGIMLGLATLTRAVFLLFPLALVAYLVIVRVGWRRAVLLFVIYALVVSTWTVYNLARWNRFVIAGEGLFAFVYVGATGWDDPEFVDERLFDEQSMPQQTEGMVPQADFAQEASEVITSDIPGYLRHRVGELAGAYLQPHGTLFFPGESLRELAANWLRDDRSVSGLIALTQGDSFWQKLILYALHYVALVFGLIGMWRTRRNWRITLPIIGFILYITLIHLFLYALPRYIFPTMVFWWVFAAAWVAGLSKE